MSEAQNIKSSGLKVQQCDQADADAENAKLGRRPPHDAVAFASIATVSSGAGASSFTRRRRRISTTK